MLIQPGSPQDAAMEQQYGVTPGSPEDQQMEATGMCPTCGQAVSKDQHAKARARKPAKKKGAAGAYERMLLRQGGK